MKRKSKLWYVLYVIFFPITISIIIWKTQKIRKKSFKIITIAAMWLAVIAIGSMDTNETNDLSEKEIVKNEVPKTDKISEKEDKVFEPKIEIEPRIIDNKVLANPYALA